jgi:diaminopimelate decarboxylase
MEIWAAMEKLTLEQVQELFVVYGSPLYVYQAETLRQMIDRITKAVPHPKTQFRFASVTNGNISLLKIFREQGWGLHANTPGDIYLGLQAGFSPSQIVYSGSNLTRSEMEQVLAWGVRTLNFDSLVQLKLCCEILCCETDPSPESINLGLRLNCPELTGDSRIGVRPEEFADAIALTHAANLKLTGLHFYRGTGTNATQAFTQVIDQVISIARKLPNWQYLDFGGGFGYPYHHGISNQCVRQYNLLARLFRQALQAPEIRDWRRDRNSGCRRIRLCNVLTFPASSSSC